MGHIGVKRSDVEALFSCECSQGFLVINSRNICVDTKTPHDALKHRCHKSLVHVFALSSHFSNARNKIILLYSDFVAMNRSNYPS